MDRQPVSIKLQIEFTGIDEVPAVFGNAVIVQGQQGYIILNFGQATPIVQNAAKELVEGIYETKVEVKPFARIVMPVDAAQTLFDELKRVLPILEQARREEG